MNTVLQCLPSQVRNFIVLCLHGDKMIHHFLYYLTECWHNLNCGFENYAICKRSPGKTYIAAAPTVSPSGGCPANWTKLASRVRHRVYRLDQEHSKYWLILQLKETHRFIFLFLYSVTSLLIKRMRRGMVQGHTVRPWEEIWLQLTQNLHKVCAKCCNV